MTFRTLSWASTPIFAALTLSACQSGAPVPFTGDISRYSSLSQLERTEIAILGTPHLFAIEGFEPTQLDATLDALAGWAPDAIGIERVPGREIEDLRQRSGYADMVPQLTGLVVDAAGEAQTLQSIDLEKALAAIGEWESSRGLRDGEAEQRLLTALAAYEPETALLYWWQLDEGTRGTLPDFAREVMQELEVSPNERVHVAARLAQRLGHPRIWSIDSQRDKDLIGPVAPQLEAGIAASDEAAALQEQEWFLAGQRVEGEAVTNGDFLPAYRFFNSPDYERPQVVGQFDLLNRVRFEDDAGRVRQAAWDIRNFGIAAHVRRVSAGVPGGKVLVVIGVGHKPALDRLLSQTLDVSIAQPAQFLAD